MSLRTSYLYLSLFSLITLFSCEDPSDIGLNLPGQNQLGTHFEKQQVAASTVIHPDSILAFQNEPIAVGKVSDGELGTIIATHYTEIGLNGNGAKVDFNVPAGRPADSLVLILAYAGTKESGGFYYGDKTVAIKLNVLKLTDNFKDDTTYFINSKIRTGDQLGTITFTPKPNRTSDNENQLLRIPLDQNFANALLQKSFTTQEEFKAFWKGIAITADPSSNAGSIVGFTTLPDSAGVQKAKVAGINLYYTDASGNKQMHNFSFGGKYFNGVQVTRQGALATLDKPNKELSSAQTNDVTYIQANTGVKTRLTFPNLAEFKTGKGNVYINHAELFLPVKAGTIDANNKITPAPPAVLLYESTTGNRIVKTSGNVAIPIQAGNAPVFNLTTPAVGIFNKDSSHYKINITSYIQALVDKRKANNGIIITPTPEDKFSAVGANLSYPGTLSLNRALIDAANNKIKLRIYYSELK